MKIKVETLSLNVLESGVEEPTLLFLHYWGGSTHQVPHEVPFHELSDSASETFHSAGTQQRNSASRSAGMA